MELSLEQALQKGIEAHQAGQIQEADYCYREILKTHPTHPEVNHNMGVLSVELGKVQEALMFFKRALKTKPLEVQFWLSHIHALIKLEKLFDAKNLLDQAKGKGFNSEAFDQLESLLFKLGSNPQDPPSPLLQPIINAYSQGRLQQAVTDATEILTLFPNSALLYNIVGASNAGLMQFHEAIENFKHVLRINPNSAEAYNNIGIALKKLGDIEASINSYKQAIKIKPDYAEAHYNIGILYTGGGDYEKAIDSFKEALKIKPDYAEAYNNMGIAFNAKEKLELAISCFNKAVSILPNYADAYYNMAGALHDKNDDEAAIKCYEHAINLNPSLFDAYNNMGLVLAYNGNLNAAINSYKKALKIKPDCAEVYLNLGVALNRQGDPEAAIDIFKQVLKIKPNHTETYNNIGIALKGMTFSKPSAGVQDIISLILDAKNYVRPNDIFEATFSLLKFEPVIKELFKKHAAGEVNHSLETLISNLSEVPLLFKLMSVCPLSALELEIVLSEVRSALLLSRTDISDSAEVLRFQTALALQCFTNEYIFSQTNKEIRALDELEILVEEELLNGQQPSGQSILTLASYRPLFRYKWSDLLIVNPAIEEVYKRQILEPKIECILKSSIPTLESITNKVSLEVREQYEVNPYPRWVNLGLRLVPALIYEITKEVKLRLFDKTIVTVKAPNILIAGCGTGQHPIGTASKFKNAKVLAVDLSFASLAYAKRKTEELGIKSIDYMQADILDLGKLDRKFDIIESVGVLHHMDEPIAGWKILTDCLEVGGLMLIGLYSELARQSIIVAREEIKQSGIGTSDAAIKSFRIEVINSGDESHMSIKSISDFYSLSELRDLLFHVQEHRFTIPQIKKCLDDLGLKFCGFEADKIVQCFQLENAGADDLYNLDKWNLYEEANPNSFVGMYQFWCQKIV